MFSILSRLLAGAVAIVLLVTAVTAANAERRVALVIGNGDYADAGSLRNPRKDAQALADVLRRLQFDQVSLKENLDYRGLRLALRDFGNTAAGADVALIYFAGHGIEVSGQNYLIPTDAALKSAGDVDFEAIPLSSVLNSVEGAQQLRLVILDACRNNPFLADMTSRSRGRSIGRGLARVEPEGQTLVAFAAKEGTVALDGDGDNSPFAEALVTILDEPGVEIGFLLRRVRDQVITATGGRQEPFTYGSLGGKPIYLNPGRPETTTAEPDIVEPAPEPEPAALAWRSVRDSDNVAQLQDFIKNFPDSVYADFARTRIAEKAWDAVKDTNDIAVLRDFADRFADNFYADFAKARIAERERIAENAWSVVEDTRDPSLLRNFTDRFPQSAEAQKARLRLARVERQAESAWESARDSRDIDKLRAFADSFPWSPRVALARALIKELEVPQESLAIYANVDFYGGDIGQRFARDLTDCAQTCADSRLCRFFTYVAKDNRCMLKQSYEFASRFDGATSGQYLLSTDPKQRRTINIEWEIAIGRDYFGNDFAGVHASGFDDCLGVCRRNDRCIAFSFAPKVSKNDNCWLKSFAGKPQNTSDARRNNIHIGKRTATPVTPYRVVHSE